MKHNFIYISILICSALIFISCENGNKEPKQTNRSFLVPMSSGNPYEVMVVADDSIWDGYAGRALDVVLNKPLKGLPQEESTFHVSRITPDNYDRITNLFRNIIIFKIGRNPLQIHHFNGKISQTAALRSRTSIKEAFQ